ncbi:hypothetical protein KIP88_43560 [Bradyrhizobium sp. SRL28]|nr:hypothetical protein [Bradyrhizobium sp. SRL28]MBT1517219.1 hypothetical protein [Bradyrhizobium sp. SRL28]
MIRQIEGEKEMTDNYETVAGPYSFVNVVTRAVLRKWPSLNNQRRMDATV